jgi:hypothetical protein
MKRIGAASLRLLAVGITLFLTACSNSPSNSALNLTGTWTVTTVSTQGHKGFSGTAAISQSGQGLGSNGATTLAATVGQIAVTQTGTAITGIITNSIQKLGYTFTGTLSSGSLTVTGSTPCGGGSIGNNTQTITIVGTITSNSAAGTYTITRGSACYSTGDAGTFVASKQ